MLIYSNIQIKKKYISEDTLVLMNRGLADILVINLLKNAIVHNSDGGMIEIELSNAHWTIKNTGPRKAIPADRLFDRFYKGSKTGGSFGLGLPLVKKICDYYDFGIEYWFETKWHSFTIIFSS